MLEISDDTMRENLSRAKPYTIVILTKGPNYSSADARAIVWEHARRNFQLRAAGTLNVVCPVTDEDDVRGVGIFSAPIEEVKALLADDPAIKAGVLIASYRSALSFPGDALQ